MNLLNRIVLLHILILVPISYRRLGSLQRKVIVTADVSLFEIVEKITAQQTHPSTTATRLALHNQRPIYTD
jgi:hypothetical protein